MDRLARDSARRAVRSGSWPQHSFLGVLTQGAREALLALGAQREYAVGSTLIMEGDACTDVIALVDGWAKVVGSTADGGRALLGLRFSGDLVGEQSALDEQPRSASVISAGPTVVHVIGRNDFLKFLMDWPGAGVAVSQVLSAKLRWATSRRVDFSGLSVLARLARVIDELAQLESTSAGLGIEFGYTLTQPEFAEMIGASEPSVHKALRELRSAGIVETGYRRIVVSDPVALRAIAGSVSSYGVDPARPTTMTPISQPGGSARAAPTSLRMSLAPGSSAGRLYRQ